MNAEKTIKVSGMHCHSCGVLLSDVLSDIGGVEVISADHKKNTIRVRSAAANYAKIRAAIEKEGYRVESI